MRLSDLVMDPALIEELSRSHGGGSLKVYVPVARRRELDPSVVQARVRAGESPREIARELDVHPRTIRRRLLTDKTHT